MEATAHKPAKRYAIGKCTSTTQLLSIEPIKNFVPIEKYTSIGPVWKGQLRYKN
jgi:hypothetical protein